MPAPCRKGGEDCFQQRCKSARWCSAAGVSQAPNQSWMGALKPFRDSQKGWTPSHSLVHRLVSGAALPGSGNLWPLQEEVTSTARGNIRREGAVPGLPCGTDIKESLHDLSCYPGAALKES